MAYGNRKTIKSIETIRGEINTFFKPDLTVLLKMQKVDDVQPVFKQLEEFIEKYGRGVTSTQMRKLFDLVKNTDDLFALQIQRPSIAHLIAKEPKENSIFMMVLVDELIAKADDVTKFGFAFFTESLIAFHRYFETLFEKRARTEKVKQNVENQLNRINPRDFLNFEKSENINKVFNALETFLSRNGKGITSTQLRNIYDKMLAAPDAKSLKLLRPVLAYTAARQANLGAINLIYFLMKLIQSIKNEEDRTTFLRLMEAFVSIHKFYESKINVDDLREQTKRNFGNTHEILESRNTTNFAKNQEKLQQFVLPRSNKEGIKSSQFRRLLNPILSANSAQEIYLLRPLFLYAAARQSSREGQRLIIFIADLIKNLKTEQFPIFQMLVTDLLHYHRYFEETKTNSQKIEIKKLTT